MMTNPVIKRGFGTQLCIILYTIKYCQDHNSSFCYTPINSFEHTSEEENKELENMLGFRGAYEIAQKECSRDDHIKVMKYILNLDFIDPPIPFKSKLKYESYFTTSKNIVLHIRRGNDFDDKWSKISKFNETYLNLKLNYSDDFYIELIDILIEKYPDYNVHIHSQRLNLNAYKKFPKLIFHLNESLTDTFCSMVLADILVIGASNLSYAAGLLRNADDVTMYIPYYYKPFKNWKKIKNKKA